MDGDGPAGPPRAGLEGDVDAPALSYAAAHDLLDQLRDSREELEQGVLGRGRGVYRYLAEQIREELEREVIRDASVDDFEALETAARSAIRDARLGASLSQREVAERMTALGFPMQQTSVAKIEAGSRPLRLAEFFALASCLEIPWITLLDTPAARAGGVETLRAHLAGARTVQERIRLEMVGAMGMLSQAYARAAVQGLLASELLQSRPDEGGDVHGPAANASQ